MITQAEFKTYLLQEGSVLAKFIDSFTEDIQCTDTNSFQLRVQQLLKEAWQDYSTCLQLVIEKKPERINEYSDEMEELTHHIQQINQLGDILTKVDESIQQKLQKKIKPQWVKLWFTHSSKQFDLYQNTKNILNAIINPLLIRKMQSVINIPWMKFASNKTLEMYGTPLMVAISNTATATAMMLMYSGADVNKYALSYGNNPLLLAISKGWNHKNLNECRHREDYKKIVSYHPINQLQDLENQKDIIKCLLQNNKLDVNATHLGNGMSALHIACLRGDNLELIQTLTDKGADLSLVDYHGKKPMDYLDTPYSEVQKTISKLTGDSFGENSVSGASHLSLTATLPTEQERANNILEIKEQFERTNDMQYRRN